MMSPTPNSAASIVERYSPSGSGRERALKVRGRLLNEEPIQAARTALVVIDMQNHFVAEGGVGEVPPARMIVPTINELANAMRSAGVLVVWIQTSATGALEHWARHHSGVLSHERAKRRLASLDENSDGFQLYPGLDVRPEDLRLTKIHYSAFIPGLCRLDEELRARGIDTVLIGGTATNVCCESTARDAMMLDYRAIMVSDANATWTADEQRATLDLFAAFFGDVMTSAQVVDRLR